MTDQDKAKQAAACHAARFVMTGMKIGLGTGSTAEYFIRALSARIMAEGLHISAIPTSERTAQLARDLGLPLITFDEADALDLAVDGADEVDDALRLIKGGGGALFREKLVASAAKRKIILVDPSKQVPILGRFALPIEIVSFGAALTIKRIQGLIERYGKSGGRARVRRDTFGEPFVTDGGNLVVDAAFDAIHEPELLASALKAITGVVDHGLFIGLCDELIVGRPDGSTTFISANGL